MRFDVGSRSGRMFVSRIAKRSDMRSMMAQGRSIGLINGGRGMTGGGFLDTLKKWYHTGRKYAGKASEAYLKYKPMAEKAYKTFKSDEVQKFVPKSVKNKTNKLEGFAKKHGSKLQVVDDLAKQFGKTEREGVEDVIPAEKLVAKKPSKEKLPGDNLRSSLLSQIKQGKSGLKPSKAATKSSSSNDPMAELRDKIASRRSQIEGSGINPAGIMAGNGIYPPGLTGSGMPWGDIFKMATKIVPAIVDQVQKGTGMSDKQAQSMTKMSLMKLKPILRGATRQSGGSFASVMEDIGNAVITPLKLISNITGQSGSGKCCKKRKKLLNQMKLHIAKVIAKSATRKQSGRGVSFGDVISGIAQTAGELLPMIL